MEANGAVGPSEAGRTPLLGAPNGEAVVPPPQDVSQATSDVTIDIPENEIERPLCEVQINNLVDKQIKEGQLLSENERKRVVAVEALKEWKEAESELQGKVERRTQQTGKLLFEIFQFAGLYSVFVGVVYTAGLLSSVVKCQHVWIGSPSFLCLFVLLLMISLTTKRLIRYNELCVTIASYVKARRAIYEQISKLTSYRHKRFDFELEAGENSEVTEAKLNLITTTFCGVQVSAPRVIPFVLTALTSILLIHILCWMTIFVTLRHFETLGSYFFCG